MQLGAFTPLCFPQLSLSVCGYDSPAECPPLLLRGLQLNSLHNGCSQREGSPSSAISIKLLLGFPPPLWAVIFPLLLHGVVFHLASRKWGCHTVRLTALLHIWECIPHLCSCCGLLWVLVKQVQISFLYGGPWGVVRAHCPHSTRWSFKLS